MLCVNVFAPAAVWVADAKAEANVVDGSVNPTDAQVLT